MHTETILACSFFFVWSFKKCTTYGKQEYEPKILTYSPLKYLFKAFLIQTNIKNLWVMLQICGDTDSSHKLCVLCSDLNVLSNFDFPTTNFMRNLSNCSQVVTWTDDWQLIGTLLHWTYSKGQSTSSIVEHGCTLHTIFCRTLYFGIKIQNSNLNRMKIEYEAVHTSALWEAHTQRGG